MPNSDNPVGLAAESFGMMFAFNLRLDLFTDNISNQGNLGRAHRRLMKALPAYSMYRETVYPTWRSVVEELIDKTSHYKPVPATSTHDSLVGFNGNKNNASDLP